MGVDFQAIIGHNLTASDLPALPNRLNSDAAPDLTQAVKLLARAYNRLHEETHRPYPAAKEDDTWLYIEPRHGANLLAPPPPPPKLAFGEGWPMRQPTTLRLFSAEEMWSGGYPIEYFGPADLRLDVHRHCCVFGIARWYTFLAEQDFQYAMRLTAYELGQIIGSSRAVYVPDSTFLPASGRSVAWEGGDLDAVSAYLQEQCGPPAPTIATIEEGYDGHSRGDGYIIDDFADLKRAERGA